MSIRKELRERDQQRFRVRATVQRFGLRRGWKGKDETTILLRDVVDASTDQLLTDHLWMKAGKWSSDLQENDIISFEARITDYVRGYFGRRSDVYVPASRDWRLERPTKVQKHEQNVQSKTGMVARV